MATLHQLVRRPIVDRACVRCGHEVGPHRASDRCPMCGGKVWRFLLPAAGLRIAR